jgi:hypothetical protein
LSNSTHFPLVLKLHKTGDVATRSRQTLDEPGAHRIRNNRKHNWDVTCRLQRRHTRNSGSQNNVGRERNQLGRRFTCPFGSVCIPPKFDLNIPSVRPTKLLQFLQEGLASRLCFSVAWRLIHDDADTRHALLRTGRKRPQHSRTCSYFDEVAPSHRLPPRGLE